MESIRASCVHLSPSPGQWSNRKAAAHPRASADVDMASDFPSCSYGWQGSYTARRRSRNEYDGSESPSLHSIRRTSGLGSVHANVGSLKRRSLGQPRAIATTGDWGPNNNKQPSSPRRGRGQPKVEKPYEKQLELLAQVRRRRELEILQREQLPTDSSSEEINGVTKIWPFWRKKEFKMRALTRRILELSKRRQLHQVFAELELAKKENEKLNHITMNAVLAACVSCGDIDQALRVFDEMSKPGGCGVDNVTYGTLLKGLGAARRLDDAFELLEALEAGTAPGRPELTDVHLNTLVNACAHAGDALRARGVLLRYRSSVKKTSVTVFTFNLLIKGYSRSDNPLEALKLMDEMHSHGLQLQRVTFNSLILACVRGGDISRALELLAEMKEEAKRLTTSRLLPDVVTYTTLLRGLADAEDLPGVCNMVNEMKETPTCVLDRVAYTAIIDACIAANSPQQGLAYLDEMQRSSKNDPQLKPRAHVFLALMRAFAERGDADLVGSLRERMVPEAAGQVWAEDRAEADELYIEAAVVAGQLGTAKQTLKNMVGLKKGLPLSKRAYMAVVRLQALTRFSEDIFSPYKLKPGVSPNDVVGNLMIPFEEVKPLRGDFQVSKVVMRFFREDSIPIVDDQGTCIGIVYAENCREMNACLKDIMSPPPPAVTSSTPISKAISLLLEPHTKLLMIISSRTIYSPNKDDDVGERALGFLTREATFSTCHALPFGPSLRGPKVEEKG